VIAPLRGWPDEPAFASAGARLTSAVAVLRDNDSFRKSASTVTPPFVWSKTPKPTVSVVGAGPSRIPRRVQRFDPDQVQGKRLVKKNIGALRRVANGNNQKAYAKFPYFAG